MGRYSKTSLDREFFVDSLELILDIEEIKRRLANQDKNLVLVFTYLDELIEKQKSSPNKFGVFFGEKRRLTSMPSLIVQGESAVENRVNGIF